MPAIEQETVLTNGGGAFPSPDAGWKGMNLRDYFAAAALPAFLAKEGRMEFAAAAAYDAAQAMMAERRKRYLP